MELLANAHWWGPWFGLFWLVLWGTVIVLLFRRRRTWWNAGHSGEDVLGERFARGEITEEEYRKRRAVLRERPGVARRPGAPTGTRYPPQVIASILPARRRCGRACRASR